MKYLLLVSFLLTNAFAVPVGSYTNGSIVHSIPLNDEGTGYMLLFKESGNYFSNQETIQMIEKAAVELAERFPGKDRLQVEELSAEKGGRIERHNSHQNGLDVDLEYFKKNGIEHRPRFSMDYDLPMVLADNSVDENFDVERNWELVKTLHKHARIQRIFMDRVLKAKLCAYAKSKNELVKYAEVLRSLRHETNHQDHMHVRLRCPVGAKQCRPFADPPAGSGCPKI